MINSKLKKYITRCTYAVKQLIDNNQFGIGMSIDIFLSQIIPIKVIKTKHNEHVCRYIENFLVEIIKKYKNEELPESDINSRSNYVWICWFTGLDNAPDIVKFCVSSILSALPEEAKPHIITLDNYTEFFELPNYILEKYRRGKMTGAALSDIFRACLLSKYGGMWFDATIFVSNSISSNILTADYFTLKANRKLLFCDDPSEGLWCGFIWGTLPDNPLFGFLRDSLFLYWKEYDKVIEYLLPDYIIRTAYLNNSNIRNLIDSFIPNVKDIWFCMKNMETVFDDNLINDINKNTIFNKITYKREWKINDSEGRITLYGHMLNNLNKIHK